MEKVQIGRHMVWYEADTQIIAIQQVGKMDLEESKAQQAYWAKHVPDDAKRMYLLVDATQGAGMTAEARAYYGEATKQLKQLVTVAIFGANFQSRVVANLLLTALKLLGMKIDVAFFATEAEARDSLASRRRAAEQEVAAG